MGVNGNSTPIGTRRSSYPSGPWVTNDGRPAKSPNSSTYEKQEEPVGVLSKRLPNPDPSNYKILKIVERGDYLILKLKYHDCVNYEGDKVILLKDTLINIVNCQAIDPHFQKGGTIVARFIPTDEGWSMAEQLCTILNKPKGVR